MATAVQTPQSVPAPTRPQLQAIKQNFTDLDEQISQATHIIGLPDNWDALSGSMRSDVAHQIVCARADWVLRWILDKLKDTAEGGVQARASVKAWNLLDWMIEILPVSRCALHLRDADFLSVVEKALDEKFGADATIQSEVSQSNRHPRDDSSETIAEDPQPSRKRKRATGTSSPSKRQAVEASESVALFHAIRATVRSIWDKADGQGTGEEKVQSEHMKMVLRTESAQAARIMKNWLTAVQRIYSTPQAPSQDLDYLDLTLVVHVWELRAIDPKDNSGASVEQFSTECLIPSLLLSQFLRQPTTDSTRIFGDTSLALDRLIAKYILLPSRSAFFSAKSNVPAEQSESTADRAALLSSSLGPLSAKLLQAAQIQDTGVGIPAYFTPLFAAVPRLLDLIIRSSPARTPKARTAEKPWIQAALVTLAQCVGCSLAPPEFAAPAASIAAFEQCLAILASYNFIIDTMILRDVFWFHSGFKYPLNQKRSVNWPLVAALVAIDSSIFLADPKSATPPDDERPKDLTSFLFEQISASNFENRESNRDDIMDIDGGSPAEESSKLFSRKDVVTKIVVPVAHAFSRNRQLLSFIDHWDDELRKTVLADREPLADVQPRIWDDRDLVLALAEVFEQSLTKTQISNLFQKHADRIEHYTKKHPKKAISSAVIIQAMLYSIKSEETIELIKPIMLSTWKTYETWVQHDGPSQSSALELAWTSLCFLLGHLWPIHFHGSATLQKEFVRPLLERASKDVLSARKEEPNRRLHSSCRTAALVFVFVACDYLALLPDAKELIEKMLPKVLKVISPGQLETEEVKPTLELFCTDYAHLLSSCQPMIAKKVLSRLLETIARFEEHLRDPLTETLSASVFNHGKSGVEAALVSAVLENLEPANDEDLQASSICALLHVSPLSLQREQREATLDKLLELLLSSSRTAVPLLNIMANLTQAPNATAKISSDGNVLFDIADALHEANLETRSSTQLLQILVKSTLGHLVPNKDQAQNKAFFETYGARVTSSLKQKSTCSPARLAVLTGTLLAAPDWNTLLPLTRYVEFLGKVLNTWSSSPDTVLDAYNYLPMPILLKHEGLLEAVRTTLREWISAKISLEDSTPIKIDIVPLDTWPVVFGAIAKYQQYPSPTWLLRVASQLLHAGVSNQVILQAIREALKTLENNSEKVELVEYCVSLATENDAKVAYQLLHAVISTLDEKQEVHPEVKARQVALMPQICSLLGDVRDDAAFNLLLDSIDTILLHKPNMTSQHNIECLLTVLLKLSTRSSPRLSPSCAPAIYSRLCETSRLLLLLHHSRSRLGGRFHLLLPILQSLLLCLFIPNLNRGAALPPWLDSPSTSSPSRLTPANAAQYAHLLSTLCSPTQSSVQKTRSATTLNDPIKAAREYASQYVFPLLSSFCRFTLYGRLDVEVREKLMPGIWEVVSVAQLNKETIDAMFAGLGKSEKDVWRGVWGEWVRLHGRKERKLKRGE
ncbi:hypothetical protein BU23DRAFT_537621 [Bimuria novae-zelandiae CBS 107.79]|uniref:Nucleolar 27S pre-rRNA processing Urb2/Npa2 C-terminal domain-containing protein n=1 Tax=Bimuria novae-zelandiae CBS 107.79 TaxID=1447943 RepID=A0A6A5V145_9PLEO|nr:hypothetical protein BU23DRAFT_537621 [Bimuria novae-zelandiae CBS 107.79]